MSVIKSREGQDIFDVTLQEFGDVQNLFDLLNANDNINQNSKLLASTELTINNENIGNTIIKSQFKKLNFTIVNSDIEGLQTEGDFNNDFNNDFN